MATPTGEYSEETTDRMTGLTLHVNHLHPRSRRASHCIRVCGTSIYETVPDDQSAPLIIPPAHLSDEDRLRQSRARNSSTSQLVSHMDELHRSTRAISGAQLSWDKSPESCLIVCKKVVLYSGFWCFLR